MYPVVPVCQGFPEQNAGNVDKQGPLLISGPVDRPQQGFRKSVSIKFGSRWFNGIWKQAFDPGPILRSLQYHLIELLNAS